MRSGNRQLIRDINRSLVLNLVKNHGPISRTDIARKSGLSLSTVSGITRALLSAGLIHEMASGESSGGRRPILLSVDPKAGYAIGLKLTESEVIAALTDLDATVLNREIAPVHDTQEPSQYIAQVEDAIDDLMSASGVAREKLMGIGVGMSGFIDHESGTCRYSAILNWRDVPLQDEMEALFDVPVLVDNDVNTLTQFEAMFGSGQGIRDFLVVTIGRGVGLGIVVHGQVYRGSQGGAGEFGHITVREDGPLCNCGKRGCLEALVAEPALVAQAQAAGLEDALPAGESLAPASLARLAREGNEIAAAIYARAGHVLGVSLANLVNLFNPACVIVSGEGARAGEYLFAPMKEALRDHLFNGMGGALQLLVEPLDDDAWARGAASLVLSEVFLPPV